MDGHSIWGDAGGSFPVFAQDELMPPGLPGQDDVIGGSAADGLVLMLILLVSVLIVALALAIISRHKR